MPRLLPKKRSDDQQDVPGSSIPVLFCQILQHSLSGPDIKASHDLPTIPPKLLFEIPLTNLIPSHRKYASILPRHYYCFDNIHVCQCNMCSRWMALQILLRLLLESLQCEYERIVFADSTRDYSHNTDRRLRVGTLSK